MIALSQQDYMKTNKLTVKTVIACPLFTAGFWTKSPKNKHHTCGKMSHEGGTYLYFSGRCCEAGYYAFATIKDSYALELNLSFTFIVHVNVFRYY